jgi:hypothetical protein
VGGGQGDANERASDLAACLAGREPGDAGARWAELIAPYQDLAASLG